MLTYYLYYGFNLEFYRWLDPVCHRLPDLLILGNFKFDLTWGSQKYNRVLFDSPDIIELGFKDNLFIISLILYLLGQPEPVPPLADLSITRITAKQNILNKAK